MQVHQENRGGRLVVTPMHALFCGGTAEDFEELLQQLLAAGHRHLLVDLQHVPQIDSGGVRALVRGYLTAQRLGGTLTLAAADRHVSRVLSLMRLDKVFPMFDTVDAAIATPART